MKVRVVRYNRSSTVDIIEYIPATETLRVRFIRNGKVWYSCKCCQDLGLEVARRFSDAKTGSFGKWASSIKLFSGMQIEQ